jgi:hypothetical protein
MTTAVALRSHPHCGTSANPQLYYSYMFPKKKHTAPTWYTYRGPDGYSYTVYMQGPTSRGPGAAAPLARPQGQACIKTCCIKLSLHLNTKTRKYFV